jgi:hypothetical protein
MLVHHHPRLPRLLPPGHPIDVIERLEIGSRPPSRRSGRGWRTCGPFPGSSPGRRTATCCPRGTGWDGACGGGPPARRGHAGGDGRPLALLHQPAGRPGHGAGQGGPGDRRPLRRAGRGPSGLEVFPVIRERWLETRDWVLRLAGRGRAAGPGTGPAAQHPPAQSLRGSHEPPAGGPVWPAGGPRSAGRTRNWSAALFETVRGISQGMQNTG